MKERINDKVAELNGLIEELTTILPANFEEYSTDYKTKAACERYIEKITEALVDLAFLIAKQQKITLPEEEKNIFHILATQTIIPLELASPLKELKGMRNILAHEYGIVDDKIVFTALTEELERDVRAFLNAVRKNPTPKEKHK